MPDRRDHALPHRVLGQLPGPDIDQLFQHLDLDELVVDGRTRLTLALGSLEHATYTSTVTTILKTVSSPAKTTPSADAVPITAGTSPA
jgi:hypothetical protein